MRHHLHYALLVILTVILGSAALVLTVEDGHEGSINSFGDALWWAATTVTTVGYGDTFPVTPAGRGIAVFLMVAGITLFGVLTANIATFLIERADEEPKEDEVKARLDELLRRMGELERRLSVTEEGVRVDPQD